MCVKYGIFWCSVRYMVYIGIVYGILYIVYYFGVFKNKTKHSAKTCALFVAPYLAGKTFSTLSNIE